MGGRKLGFYDRYQPPAKDSARAKGEAQMFLYGARSLDGIDAATLAHRYRLSEGVAADMLARALGEVLL